MMFSRYFYFTTSQVYSNSISHTMSVFKVFAPFHTFFLRFPLYRRQRHDSFTSASFVMSPRYVELNDAESNNTAGNSVSYSSISVEKKSSSSQGDSNKGGTGESNTLSGKC